MLINIDYL